MLRASRMLLQQASHVKRTTGIVGLNVVPNAKEVLTKLYEKTLNDIKIIPAGVPYRTEVESFTNYRLGVVKKHTDVRFRLRVCAHARLPYTSLHSNLVYSFVSSLARYLKLSVRLVWARSRSSLRRPRVSSC